MVELRLARDGTERLSVTEYRCLASKMIRPEYRARESEEEETEKLVSLYSGILHAVG